MVSGNFMIKHISILGSGNVAYHIARKLRAESFVIDCVFSRNHITGQSLADEVNAVFTDDLFQISSKSDAYLFMMSDEANASIAAQISLPDEKICIHTSGSLPKEIFKQKNAAVMYPFQTFSRDVMIDNFSEIPVCIETSNADTFHEVRCLAEKISPLIYELSFEQRKVLHVAGVFAANFMNHSVCLGQKLLQENNIPINILTPLLKQSFAKILAGGAYSSQTGPAVRGDRKIIDSHIDMLASDENLADVYKIMSESILKTYNK